MTLLERVIIIFCLGVCLILGLVSAIKVVALEERVEVLEDWARGAHLIQGGILNYLSGEVPLPPDTLPAIDTGEVI